MYKKSEKIFATKINPPEPKTNDLKEGVPK